MNQNFPPPRPVPQFDMLDAFARWYMQNVGPTPHCPMQPVSKAGPHAGIILYRSGEFQVQLWIVEPNSIVPEHTHPNVDSIQIYLSGDMVITKNGADVFDSNDTPIATMDGVSPRNGFAVRITNTDSHGGRIGQKGSVFLSVQRWINGTPTSVEMDWIGEAIDADHAKQLEQATP